MNRIKTQTPLVYSLIFLFFHFSPELEAASGDDTDVCAQAVFCSGFEEGSLAIWNNPPPAPTTLIMVDPGPSNKSGNHVIRLRVPAGRGGTAVKKDLLPGYDKVYARWYQKWEPGYDFSALNHGSGLHAGDRWSFGKSGYRPNGDDWFNSLIEPAVNTSGSLNGRLQLYSYYRGMYQNCGNPQGGCWGDVFPCMWDEGYYCTKPEHRERIMPPKLQTGRWYCIETMIDGGAPSADAAHATGVQDYWLDGVEYGPWTNLWHRTTANVKLILLSLGLFHHEQHSVEGIMLDNVVVSTKHIGCLNGGLNPQTNLRIVQ